ncbi:MAG TPA: fumarate hydratase [Synergistaceae bacterium]|nr:fumarate hydratase [Synergistaceae bacterium]
MSCISVSRIRDTVRSLALQAAFELPGDISLALEEGLEKEESPLGRAVFEDLLRNRDIARKEGIPLCQDCGMAVLFVDLGESVHLEGGSLEEALQEGIRAAYTEGYLRKSVVRDPLFDRKNTGDNTPAIIHYRRVPGNRISITVAPKGMGSENMSRIYMLRPADGEEGVLEKVVETVALAGPNPCPPLVLGICVGGNFETAPLGAKRALLRPLGQPHPDLRYAALERRILEACNDLGIGPGGYGGSVTVLGVAIEDLPTHIAGMPLAINVCCHALRHASADLGEEE